MDVNFECYKCKSEQVAKGVTEEVPTPVNLMGTCEACGHRTSISEQGREKWLEDRGFEITNTSHPRWHVKDVNSVDDLQCEFSLIFQGHHRLYGYQIGYFGGALLFFQQWAQKRGFDCVPPSRYVRKVTVTYDHVDGNSHHIANNHPIGFYGSDEAVEAGIAERMSWDGKGWLTRGHFRVELIDTGYACLVKTPKSPTYSPTPDGMGCPLHGCGGPCWGQVKVVDEVRTEGQALTYWACEGHAEVARTGLEGRYRKEDGA